MIPYAGSCEHRQRALDHIKARYADRHPDWKVTVATAPPGPWIKALPVNAAICASVSEVVIVADADVWCDHLDLAVDGCRTWAIPHGGVYRLTEAATLRYIATPDCDPYSLPLVQRPYRGYPGGGIVIARREHLLEVPMDPRFVGWGQEDESFAIALRCIYGKPWRGHAPLWHLFHTPQQRESRQLGSKAGVALRNRYIAARKDKRAMHELLDEIRRAGDDRNTDNPALHSQAV